MPIFPTPLRVPQATGQENVLERLLLAIQQAGALGLGPTPLTIPAGNPLLREALLDFAKSAQDTFRSRMALPLPKPFASTSEVVTRADVPVPLDLQVLTNPTTFRGLVSSGGGAIGAEAAKELSQQGTTPTFKQFMNFILRILEAEGNRRL